MTNVQWYYYPARHCGRCNNPTGVFNRECTGPHFVRVLGPVPVESEAAA